MNRKLMVSDVFMPKLLDGCPVTFERAEGLNDFIVRVNGEERVISRELWRSLMDMDHSLGPLELDRKADSLLAAERISMKQNA